MQMRIMIFLFSFFVLIHCSKESKDIASEFALTEEDKAAALQIHNNARTDVGVPPLTWSEALANDAAAWAKNMASREQMYHSQNNSRKENTPGGMPLKHGMRRYNSTPMPQSILEQTILLLLGIIPK